MVYTKYLNITILSMIIFIESSCQSSAPNGFDVRLFAKTPVFEFAKAIKDEDTDLLEKIGNDRTILFYQEPKFGESLLDYAVITGKYNAVKELLELGADPNQVSKDGYTPFLDACKYSGANNESY